MRKNIEVLIFNTTFDVIPNIYVSENSVDFDNRTIVWKNARKPVIISTEVENYMIYPANTDWTQPSINTPNAMFRKDEGYVIWPSKNNTTTILIFHDFIKEDLFKTKEKIFYEIYKQSEHVYMYYICLYWIRNCITHSNQDPDILKALRKKEPIKNKFVQFCSQEPSEITYNLIQNIIRLDYSTTYVLPKSDGYKVFIFIYHNMQTKKSHAYMFSTSKIYNIGPVFIKGIREPILIEGELIDDIIYPYNLISSYTLGKTYNIVLKELEQLPISTLFDKYKVSIKEYTKLDNGPKVVDMLENPSHHTDGLILVNNTPKDYIHSTYKYKPTTTIDLYQKDSKVYYKDETNIKEFNQQSVIPLVLGLNFEFLVNSDNKEGVVELMSTKSQNTLSFSVTRQRIDKQNSNKQRNVNKMLLNMLFPISVNELLKKFNNLPIYFEKDKRAEEYHLMRQYSGHLSRDILHSMQLKGNIVDFGAGREKYLEQLKHFNKLYMIDNDIISCAQFLDDLKYNPQLDYNNMKYIIASLSDPKNNDEIVKICQDIDIIMCMFSIHYYFNNFFEILKEMVKKPVTVIIGFVDLFDFNNSKYPVQHLDKDMIKVKLPFTDESHEEKVSFSKIETKLKDSFKSYEITKIAFNDLKQIQKIPSGSKVNYNSSYELLYKEDKQWIDRHSMVIIKINDV